MVFPNDSDGDALQRLAERSDMSQPMDIDFFVDVPDREAGNEVARLAGDIGYKSIVEFDESSQRWTCYCTRHMVATYAGVLEAQHQLDALSAPFGGRSDGWGTSGT